MLNRLITPVLIIFFIVTLLACSPGTEEEEADLSSESAKTTSLESNDLEIIDMYPAPGAGISANDPITLVIRYNLIPADGVLEVWYERFEDSDCTIRAYDSAGNFILPGTSFLTMEGGYYEMGIGFDPIPPVDANYLGIAVRLWNTDISEVLAEDIHFQWCYPSRPAVAVIPAQLPVLPFPTEMLNSSGSNPAITPSISIQATSSNVGSTGNTQLPPGTEVTPTWTVEASYEELTPTWTAEVSYEEPTPTWTIEPPAPPSSTGMIIISAFVDSDGSGSMESAPGSLDYPLTNLGVMIATEDCLTSVVRTTTGSNGIASVAGLSPRNYCVIVEYAGIGTLTPGHNTWVTVFADMNSFAVFAVLP